MNIEIVEICLSHPGHLVKGVYCVKFSSFLLKKIAFRFDGFLLHGYEETIDMAIYDISPSK